jgi:hypothetical protein
MCARVFQRRPIHVFYASGAQFTMRVCVERQAHVSESFLNCLGWGMHRDGFFNRSIRLSSPILGLNHESQSRVNVSLMVPPTLRLTDDKEIIVDVRDALIQFHLVPKSAPDTTVSQPFGFTVKVQTTLVLKAEVDGSVSWDVRRVSMEKTSALNTHHDGWMQETGRAVTEWMRAVREDGVFTQRTLNALVPTPIRLPWPLDSIQVKDFGLHVNRGVYTIEADFGL